jgi:hypothetical protein
MYDLRRHLIMTLLHVVIFLLFKFNRIAIMHS